MRCRSCLFVAAASFAVVACGEVGTNDAAIERDAEDSIGLPSSELLPRRTEGPYAPRDECSDLAQGAVFLGELRNAVSRRDADALIVLAAEDVHLDFGGGRGRELLRERLDDEFYRLWEELDELLPLGCAASEDGGMTMPWYFAQEFPIATDGSTYDIVIGEDVPIFVGSGEGREQLAAVSWDKVELLVDAREGSFVRWTDPASGEVIEGMIDGRLLRGHYHYRLHAEKREGRWQIASFIAGD